MIAAFWWQRSVDKKIFTKNRRCRLTIFKTNEKIFSHTISAFFKDRQKMSSHSLDKLVSFSKIFANIFTLRGERSNLAIGKRLTAPQKTKKYRIESDAEQNLQAQSVSRVLSRINIYLSQALPQGLSD